MTTSRYDHQVEVCALRSRAKGMREEAARVLAAAGRRAADLEQAAAKLDAQAAHVHRLCSRGAADGCCDLPPGESSPSPVDGQ